MEEFARLLRDAIGLDPSSVGMASIERAVQQRMVATGIAGAGEYLVRARSTPSELQALIELVVVSETWFFRDPKAFGAVADQVQNSFKTRLHILCVPCSTGEEPYSLAMALLDAGILPQRFHIDAIDVSERVVQYAKRGIYGRNSFRGRDLEFREKYFEKTDAGHVIAPAVRALVNLEKGNLLDAVSMSSRRTYDAIFCRNLLIYFDAETQQRAIGALVSILAEDGLIFTGPAEMGLMLPHNLEPARLLQAFAFRKKIAAQPVPAKPARFGKSAPAAHVALPPKPAPVRVNPRPRVVPVAPKAAPATPAAPDLREAVRLANEGRLGEVTAICQASLKQGPNAEAFYLLGVVSDAEGRADEATAHYRKALYLDPQHHDALLHFSLLSARLGASAAAQSLQARARRCIPEAA